MKSKKTSFIMTSIATAVLMLFSSSLLAVNNLESISESTKVNEPQKLMFTFKEPVKESDFNSFLIGAPPKIAMEMIDAQNSSNKNSWSFSRGPARSLSIVKSPKGLRAVVDLDKSQTYKISTEGKVLTLTFDNALSNGKHQSILTSSSFKIGDKGESRFILKFNKSSAQTNFKEVGDFIYISAPNSSVDEGLLGDMDLSKDSSRMKSVSIKKDDSGSAVVIIEKTSGSSASAYQLGDEYVVEIFETAKIKTPEVKIASTTGEGIVTQPAKTDTVKKEVAVTTVEPKKETKEVKTVQKKVVAVEKTDTEVKPKSSQKELKNKNSQPKKQEVQNYASQSTVSFNFQDVPLRTVIQLIAEESKMNVVVSDAVGGNVTMNLVKVPWERALDIILRSKGLDKRKDGNLIWVGPQKELVDYERAQSEAKAAMETSEDTVTEYINVNYGNAKDIASILSESKASAASTSASPTSTQTDGASKGFLSERGSVGVDTRTNTLIVSDIPKKIEEIKEMLKILDRPVDQVLIEARVVVASDSFARDLGAKFGVADRYPADPSNPGTTSSSGFVSDFTNAASNTLLNFNILGKNTTLDFELTAMQEQGKGEVVSNPRVITSNQKEAIIRQGEEIGYVTTQVTGTSTIPQSTVQFKEVLLELKVTPVITQDGKVFLTVGLKKDEVKSYVSTPSGDVPQIAKREVNTNVLIDNGQTLVIGGVYEFKNRDDVGKVPFLGDIPFLGNLFKSSSKSSEKAELLVFITPKVMRPLNTASQPIK